MILKRLKKAFYILSIVLVLGTVSVQLFDKDFAGKFTKEDNSELVAKGKALYVKRSCFACHGVGGNKPISEDYPLIGGQPRKYLEQQMKDIRDGNRDNGSSSLMKSSISRLKDQEAYLIALYLSEL